ncbi:orotate phosphoribosyltransferase [Clostridium intestinale]|uniref:Orotate phosphoribosyltransferase n=1 Tax=Clostridium intestinale DSM 6191 TaxID=1121320 RepID=A0A1M5VQQ8_9CLOT|nr:orotate phosphoribosyltransferase [Clostridium intestinale]SHH77589.1 orotate phosphoribosyltransferase [Clostridium intestinale DSM 6191]
MEAYKKEFIEFMIECGVLTFGDFVTKSGRKTPFFVNTGNYKTGSQLSRLGDFYAKAIKDNFVDTYDVVFGPAYKGIPLSVTTSISLSKLYGIDKRYCSNRKEIKDHGDKGILLGSNLNDGDRVLIVEDVTTAGTSIYETMPILKSQGDVTVEGLIISVDRMERGQGDNSALVEIREKFGFKTCAIVTMKEVINYLYKREIQGKIYIDDEIMGRIEEYYKTYGAK